MLLGYIYDVVKDQQMAEQYLADIFRDLHIHITDFANGQSNEYCKLQLLARKKLTPYFDTIKDCNTSTELKKGNGARSNKFIDLMNAGQQTVFCGVHYHGKTVNTLASELSVDEITVRKLLKEAFAIIRNNRNDAGVH